MVLDSMREIFDQMEAHNLPFWEVVLQADMEDRQVTRNQSMAKMLTTWQAMVDAAERKPAMVLKNAGEILNMI